MFFRSITLQEANSFLPLVKDRCEQIRTLLTEGQSDFENLALSELKKKQSGGEHSLSGAAGLEQASSLDDEKLVIEKQLRKLELKIHDQVMGLRGLGAKVQNIHPARISFLSERHKQPVYLSWQAGEEAFAHWHGVDEPFSYRRPIDNKEAFGQTYIN